MKRPGLACLARGGQPQIQREQSRLRDVERMSNGDEIAGDWRLQHFMPNFDGTVATRPVGDIDKLRRELPRFEAGGYADRGYEGGYGSFADAMGNTSWGGWDYSGPTGGGYVGSTEGATQGYGSNGYDWGGGNTYSGTFDTSGASDSGMGGGVGGSEPQGGGDWNGGGSSYGEGTGGEYGGGYSDPYGGADPNTGGDPFGGFGSGIGGGLGWDPLSSTPISQQNIDLTAPQTNYSRDIPAEYASPNQTIPGEAPTTSSAGMLAGLAAPLDLSFDIDPREAQRERARAEALGEVEDDQGMPSAITGSANEKGRGLYDMSVIGALSPQTMGQFFTVEQDPRAARAMSKELGITYQEALDRINRPLMETVYNRAAQREISPLNVLNERAQFSGVPGTFGKGAYPGNVQAVKPDPEMVLSAQRINNELVGGSKAYPSVVDYYNPSVPGLSSWTDKMARQPDIQTIGTAPFSHVFGNVDRVSVPSYEIAGPTYGAAPKSADAGFSFPSISDMLGISSAQAAMRSSTPEEQEDPGTSYNTAYGATPSFMQETYAPDTIGRGVGGSPFGYAGTPNFDSAMRGMNPQYGIMTNDIPSNDLPAGLPSFVGAGMARAFDPAAFSGPALGGTFGPQPSGQMVDERPAESYGFAGPAVGYDERPSKPDTFAGTGGRTARGSQLADDLTAPIEVSSPRVASVDPDKPEEEDAPSSPSGRSSTSTRAVDPLTGKSYNPQTGYTYLAEPNTVARVLDAVVSPVPVLGPLNMLGSLFGYSVGNGMAKGVPADPRDPIAYGGAGSDSRDAQYLGPSQAAPAASPAASPSEALGIPVNADWARRNYLGVNDPRRYGLNPQQTMFAARGGLASLRGK